MFKKTVSFAEAKRRIEWQFCRFPFIAAKTVAIADAFGKVLASDVMATENVPLFDRSTVDGYAVRSADTCGCSDSIPATLALVCRAEMGKDTETEIVAGQCCYVPTGAMLPKGADAVVMKEYTRTLSDTEVAVFSSVAHNENMIAEGEDFSAGDTVIAKGETLTPLKVGALAACGAGRVTIVNPIRFSVLSTGDELIDIDAPRSAKSQVRDTNTSILAAQILKNNDLLVDCRKVKDDLSALKTAISHALSSSDVVLLSGGSSIGEKDYTERALSELGGTIIVNGIAMRPGMPTLVAAFGEKLVFGLAGHPLACLMTAKLLVFEPLSAARGQPDAARKVKLFAAKNFHSAAGRAFLLPVIVDGGSFLPAYSKSGLVSVIAKADGFVVVAEDEEGVSAGEVREVILL